MTTEARS